MGTIILLLILQLLFLFLRLLIKSLKKCHQTNKLEQACDGRQNLIRATRDGGQAHFHLQIIVAKVGHNTSVKFHLCFWSQAFQDGALWLRADEPFGSELLTLQAT